MGSHVILWPAEHVKDNQLLLVLPDKINCIYKNKETETRMSGVSLQKIPPCKHGIHLCFLLSQQWQFTTLNLQDYMFHYFPISASLYGKENKCFVTFGMSVKHTQLPD